MPEQEHSNIKKLHDLLAIYARFPALRGVVGPFERLPISPLSGLARRLFAVYSYHKLYRFRLTLPQLVDGLRDSLGKSVRMNAFAREACSHRPGPRSSGSGGRSLHRR